MLNTFSSNNVKLKVTGMLLYDNQSFFQVLEGEHEVITRLYDSICNDSRHRLCTTLLDEEIPHREFPDWSMGFFTVKPQDLNNLEGLNDIFFEGKCLEVVDMGIARKLLEAFARSK